MCASSAKVVTVCHACQAPARCVWTSRPARQRACQLRGDGAQARHARATSEPREQRAEAAAVLQQHAVVREAPAAAPRQQRGVPWPRDQLAAAKQRVAGQQVRQVGAVEHPAKRILGHGLCGEQAEAINAKGGDAAPQAVQDEALHDGVRQVEQGGAGPVVQGSIEAAQGGQRGVQVVALGREAVLCLRMCRMMIASM